MSTSLSSREMIETELLEAIRDVSHAILTRLNPAMAAEGLNPPMFWHLHHLERSGVKHPGELARRLGITAAACTWSVDQLVELGLVARRPSERDRRQVVLELTPKGHRTLEAVWREFDVPLREVLAPLASKDVATTTKTLRTVALELRAGSSPAKAEAPA